MRWWSRGFSRASPPWLPGPACRDGWPSSMPSSPSDVMSRSYASSSSRCANPRCIHWRSPEIAGALEFDGTWAIAQHAQA